MHFDNLSTTVAQHHRGADPPRQKEEDAGNLVAFSADDMMPLYGPLATRPPFCDPSFRRRERHEFFKAMIRWQHDLSEGPECPSAIR